MVKGTERNVEEIEKEGVENAHTRKFIIRLNNKCGVRRAGSESSGGKRREKEERNITCDLIKLRCLCDKMGQ